ncbi:hypothetical protein BDW22DRAFT_942578 [Trametopsis cervina]|nr:hypothetical protein BDW22DRAFT_942578 [Trametopsis cervina]
MPPAGCPPPRRRVLTEGRHIVTRTTHTPLSLNPSFCGRTKYATDETIRPVRNSTIVQDGSIYLHCAEAQSGLATQHSDYIAALKRFLYRDLRRVAPVRLCRRFHNRSFIWHPHVPLQFSRQNGDYVALRFPCSWFCRCCIYLGTVISRRIPDLLK